MARHCVRLDGTPSTSCLPPRRLVPRRLFRHLALGQRTRLRPQLPAGGLYDQQAVAAAAGAAGAAGSLNDSVLAAARMVEGMPRLSVLDVSGIGSGDSFVAFLRAAQRQLQARRRITEVVGYSIRLLPAVEPALLVTSLPHLQRFEGDLPYACGTQWLQALAHACPLQQLSCSLDRCDEATAAAIGACTTLRGLRLGFWRHPQTHYDADVSRTRRAFDRLLLPALARLTRLTCLEVPSKERHAFHDAPSLHLPWPDLAPLAALTALQRLQLMSCCGLFSHELRVRLSQLPASSLSALTQLRLHGTGIDDIACVDDDGLAALARAAPALQELDIELIVGLDAMAPNSAAPWTMPHLTTLTLRSCFGPSVSVVCAAALLARAPRLRELCATFDGISSEAVPLEMHVRALAHIAAAGKAALCRLNNNVFCLPPARG